MTNMSEPIERANELFDERADVFFRTCNSFSGLFGSFWMVKLTKSGAENRNYLMVNEHDYRGRGTYDNNFVKWWRAQSGLDYESVEVYTSNTPCKDCASKLNNWLRRNRRVKKLAINFVFVATGGKNDRKLQDERLRALQELKDLSGNVVGMRKINLEMLKELAEEIDIPFKGYPWYDDFELESQITSIDNEDLQGESSSFSEPITRLKCCSKSSDISFFKHCNTTTTMNGTSWRVKLRGSAKYPDIMKAFEQGTSYLVKPHVEDQFISWWTTRKRLDFESVEVYTNNTPCIKCANNLKNWLEENGKVRELTINFAFVFTGGYKPRKTKDEYVKALQNLRDLPGHTVRIKKINSDTIRKLAGEIGIPFKGYPWYDEFELESQIINDNK